jgi:hypothetical protein
MRKAHYWAIAADFLLSAQFIGAQELTSFSGGTYRDFLRAAYAQLERFTGFLEPSKIRFLADGGGDGGGGDGGGGDGSGSSGDGGSSSSGDGSGAAGTGDSSGSAGDSASAGDASASDSASDAAGDAPSNDDNDNATDPDLDPPSNPANNNADAVNTALTNPTNAVTPEVAAIEDIATTDPRGGEVTRVPDDIGLAPDAVVTTVPPGGFPPPGAPLENVEIHAVIVSAAQSPWDAIKRSPGIGTVTVVGGIVALGKRPIQGEIPGGGPQPDWLRLIPDLRL